MKSSKKSLVYLVIGVMCLSFALSYFYRPQPPERELVTASQEMPHGTNFVETGAAPMSKRVANSFTLALVLVKSEFSEKNATGIECMRVWAQENFQRDPSFLRPVTLKIPVVVHHSIIDSFFYNLLAGPIYFLQDHVMDFLSARIADFHNSKAYLSFVGDYYDSFGMDVESATLLARYQSERAKLAVNVVLGAVFWLLVAVGGVVSILTARAGRRSSRGQWLLAYGWLLVALLYLVVGWIQNSVPVMTSAIMCGAIGLYLCKPFKLQISEESALNVKFISLSPQYISIFAWISVSLIAIRLITWAKTGTLFDPDPITLLASSISGDFLHEPVHAKKNIKAAVGLIWLLFGLWTTYYVSYDPKSSAEVERTLDSLQPINK